MKTSRLMRRAALLLMVVARAATAFGQGTAFTYQGRLNSGGAPANGSYDLQFTIYDAGSGGNVIAGPQLATGTPISNGLFTVTLDFGAAPFTGAIRWLDIGVRTNGGSTFTSLVPRQALSPTPYSIFAGGVNAAGINGTISAGNIGSGTITSTMLASGAAASNLQAGGQSAVPSGGIILSSNMNDTSLQNAGYVKLGLVQVSDAWEPRPGGPTPGGRQYQTAIWTGTEWIMWGGYNGAFLGDGQRFNPVYNTWTPVSVSGAPSPRYDHTAVWTGTEMIIWGGTGASLLKDGGRYVPAADTWTPLPTSTAPAARYAHTAVWSGSQMIIWGGYASGSYLNSGAAFNPLTGAWTATATAGAPPGREFHTAVWTGTEMLIWGGGNATTLLNDGARYNLAANTWSSMPTNAALLPREAHTAIWSGSEMIIWGGLVSVASSAYSTNDGARFNPSSSTWAPVSLTGAPSPRNYHTTVWTGNEMIVWAGENYPSTALNTGGRYNPATDQWTTLSTLNAPVARYTHVAAWIGSEMLVWGGVNSGGYVVNGGRYNTTSNTWTQISGISSPSPRSLHTAVWTGNEVIPWGGSAWVGSGTNVYNDGARFSTATRSWNTVTNIGEPSPRARHSAVWTGNEMIIWGGTPSVDQTNALGNGARYNPALNTWTPIADANAPGPRFDHSAVWSGTEMILWGGCSNTVTYGFLSDGGRYNPVADSWIYIPGGLPPAPRGQHTVIWTGSEMIVWGGGDASFTHNDGGRYNPAVDAWTALPTAGAPLGRQDHTAVWTGTEMIIWGGKTNGAPFYYSDGARYNPAANTWTAVASAGAPTGRGYHSAVWTGTAMIIWGGYSNFVYYGDGARYNPVANSWTAVAATGAPSGRQSPTAVWTGTEMIIWGGLNNNTTLLGDGARYNPTANTWTAVPSSGLTARYLHSAVWTGSEMIIWGGQTNSSTSQGANDGARYNPTANTWTAVTTVGAPSQRVWHTAVWTGSEMIIWGGEYGFSLGDGARYNPVSNSWSPVSAKSAPGTRYTHTAIWTGTEMMVWGGYFYLNSLYNGYLNDGGRYNPALDSWSLLGPPGPHSRHTAVWDGTEMIVFGHDGWRYNPSNGRWTSISTNGSPPAYVGHAAVWTGNEMLVWGGSDSGTYFFGTGARYNPTSDTWTQMSTNGAPSPRRNHIGVWTGSEFVIWGGGTNYNQITCYNNGARYSPTTDGWTPMTSAGTPAARINHTAVWTGSEVLVWGGDNGTNVFGDLNSYTPARTMYLYVRP